MTLIRNRKRLLLNASSPTIRRAREIALDIIEASLKVVNPYNIIQSSMTLEDDILKVGNQIFDLMLFNKILVVGGGKASGIMAEALEKILGSRIFKGLVVVPKGTAKKHHLRKITLHEASHPIPDIDSMEGASRVLEIAQKAKKDDLVIALISGGGSSLMALPLKSIHLSDKQIMTTMLLRSGANINEINSVRKHISQFKGGQLAKAIYPATLLGLILSDVIGDPIDVISSGPTAPDSTTFAEALNVLNRYNLLKIAPSAVREALYEGSKKQIPETPKSVDPIFKKVNNVVLGNNRFACKAAIKELKTIGLNSVLLTSFMEGEARDIGTVLAAIAKEIRFSGNPIPEPAGIIVGGETTVSVRGDGKGGRNQEIALSAALKIHSMDGVVIASVGTDGIDGPTDAAGAIVDGSTIARSHLLNIDAEEHMRNNDSYSFFLKTKDLVFTGPTETNVNDVSIIIVLRNNES